MSDNETPHPSTIRWEAPDAAVWELEAAHGTGLPPVPMRDDFERGFAAGFRKSFGELGLPLSHLELRHINGWPYTSIFLHDVPRKAGDPPPPFVLKLITRLHPGFRRRTKIAGAALESRRPQRFADEWFAERDSWIERILSLQRVELESLDADGLANHLRAVRRLASDGLRRHFELVAGCIPLGEWLVECERWDLPAAAAREAVMHSTPVHDEAQRRLRRVAAAIGDRAPANLDDVRSIGPEASEALDDYLDHHGSWITDDNVSSPVVADSPATVLAAIGATRRLTEGPSHNDPDEALARLRASVPEEDRSRFDDLAADAHRAHMMLDDNSGITAGWTGGVAAVALRHAAAWLADEGRIDSTDHIWSLDFDEIVALVEGESTLTADDVARRHQEWTALADLDPPAHLNGPGGPPPDAAVFPAPVATLVRSLTTFLDDKFNWEGNAASIGTGVVSGRAVVVSDASEAMERIEPGDILVTSATTPAFNSILSIVGGLVVSAGGPACHAAVVARELGIPAIVGYEDARSLPDGATIELDLDNVTVRPVDSATPVTGP